jgi:4-alpha-glucanotransferase
VTGGGSKLRELSGRLGIISEYVNQTGRVVRASDHTHQALLSILGFDTPGEAAARGWLDELDHEERETILAPVRVVARDDRTADRVRVQLPPGVARADVRVTLTEEAGHVWHARQEVSRAGTVMLPSHPPYGYHRVVAEVRSGTREWTAEQSLIVVPRSCAMPKVAPGARNVMGVVANLYATRREHDWGIGDFTTLTRLVEWAAGRGAAFVGINPLHALFNYANEVSPYSPITRLFRNPIYVDVDSVKGLDRSEPARALLNASDSRAMLRSLRETKLVDYDGVATLKLRVLAELHRTFRDRGGADTSDYQDFVRLRDPELTLFATWMAIAEHSRISDWRRWPAAFHDPASSDVTSFREANAERVDFYRWLQFEANWQLFTVAQRARALGMVIGVYQDLAIGTHPGGSDTWTYPELFLGGASIGAPPDPYSATGQVWGLPPMSPRGLRQQRYRYWIQLLRRAFEHAGALRIDHVMGLFRLFWIPDGGTGKDGAYVRYPAGDLLGILALESVRHDALVVGEDLGTVPAEVPPALRKWGLLSSKVLYFERDKEGFKPAARYPSLALATANTHDMPTLSGFWTERDIDLRHQVGLLRTSAELRREKRQRAADKKALLDRLRLAHPRHYEEARFPSKLTAAVHEFLCSSPAALVGESLDDLTGESEPVNVPGVGPDKYPSWRRKSRMTMEEITWSFAVDDAMRCEKRRAR